MLMTFDEVKNLMKVGFLQSGYNEENADLLADSLAVAEARGMASHGVQMTARYIRFVTDFGAHANPEIKISRDYPSTCLIDGDRGLGAIVMDKATDIAIEKAKATGSSTICVTNTFHYGAGAYYVEKAANAGTMAYLYCGNQSCAVPFGGAEAYLGTNPYSFAAPAGKYGNFVLDMATTKTAAGKVVEALNEGRELKPGLIIDKNGNPSVIPKDLFDGGALTVFGEHKGYGISYMTVVASDVLSGAEYHKGKICIMADMGDATAGYFLQVTDIEKFMDVSDFTARMEDMLDELQTVKTAPGFDKIYYPGEIENAKYAKALKDGLNVSDVAYKNLIKFYDERGIKY